jgi:hypothetical protein
MSKIHFAILPNTIVLNFDGKTKNISKDNAPLYEKVLAAIREKRTQDIPAMLDVIGTIAVKSNQSIQIRDGYVYIDGDPAESSIAKRIMDYNDKNIPYDGLVAFWRNLKQNPSYRARQRLFLFLENGGHPFTDDGCFIAYKAVNRDFKDIRTNTFDNSIGAKPKMDRSLISDDPTVTCEPGLHVASFGYLTGSGYYTRTSENGYVYICVKVNPKDVVSIPIDYSNQKMRVTEYEVLSVSDSPLTDIHYSNPKPPEPVKPVEPEPVEPSSESSSSESSSSEEEIEEEDSVEVQDNENPPGFVQSPEPAWVDSSSESSSSED